MRSHHYEFRRGELIRLAGLPLIFAGLFAALMHGGAALRLLPLPRPTLDVDRTIIIHQAEASRSRSDAEVLLIGDSSCLMNVSANRLSQALGARVLNLGTLSYLNLEAYALLAREFARANPAGRRSIMLLMHPEALRRWAPEDYHTRFLHAFLRGEDQPPGPSFRDQAAAFLGLHIFQGRLWCRFVPSPLGGAFGRTYGFSHNLERYLEQNSGSLYEPETQSFRGNAEYRLAATSEKTSRTFRAAVPAEWRLWVGITPVPARMVDATYLAQYQEMLRQWSQWLGASTPLAALPASMPDPCFAKSTHLNRAGVEIYTDQLAGVIKGVGQTSREGSADFSPQQPSKAP